MRAILIPSKFEAKLLIKRMENSIHYKVDEIDCWLGELGDNTITIAIIGMGAPHAVERADKFIRKTGPSDIVLAGFVGALSPHLKRGEIIIDCNQTRVHTAETLVGTAQEKHELYTRTHCEAVDMEGSFIAEMTNNYRLKFTAIRAVSDLANETLPMDILSKSYDQATGRYTTLSLIWFLLTHPGKIKVLQDFLAPLKEVRECLTEAIAEFIKSKPISPENRS